VIALNRDQQIKLLKLTDNEYDAKALSAVHRAKAFLRQHRATLADPFARPQRRDSILRRRDIRDLDLGALTRVQGQADFGIQSPGTHVMLALLPSHLITKLLATIW
jgi:hypothetical protein